MTMMANSSVNVPAGTTITAPNGTIITVSGSSDTVITQPGAVVRVPAGATGPANDIVTTGYASGNGLSTSALSVTSLAGSATTNLYPADGTGAAAILWGGGHLAMDSSNDVILSDRGSLRKVTQAGVVTTLTTQGFWDGVAIDPSGAFYGSGNASGIATPSVVWRALLQKFSASGAYQQLFTNWESSSTNTSDGFGGLVMDSRGALFLADAVSNRIVKFNVDSNTWAIFAGSGASGNQDGPGTAATFTLDQMPDLAIDSNDNLYVRSADAVRKIAPDGTVTTIASQLPATGAIAIDKSGNIYTAGYQAIIRITSGGSVASYPFTNTTDFITSLVTDRNGNVYAGTRGFGAQIFRINFADQ
ncbi:hypothetical protein AAGS40_30400 (plasmid) [Paraburkholderia sp. PREW-6R]|uniref:hypothetical protein n=1 Tax=Paraburkholderia sp. PREW-6R TaxID=3141544 RepID=UPI0031F52D37